MLGPTGPTQRAGLCYSDLLKINLKIILLHLLLVIRHHSLFWRGQTLYGRQGWGRLVLDGLTLTGNWDGVKNVLDSHCLEDIGLVRAAHVVVHSLCGGHCGRLALGRIDLSHKWTNKRMNTCSIDG